MAEERVVAEAELRHGLPRGSLSKVWSVECSRQTVPGPACRNKRLERGAFQMKAGAADDVGCYWALLGEPGKFAYEADCGARYLKHWLLRCRDIHRAQGAYNLGRCTDRTAYARKVAKR